MLSFVDLTLSQTKPELLAQAAQKRLNVVEGMNPLQQGFLPSGDIQKAIQDLETEKAKILDSRQKNQQIE